MWTLLISRASDPPGSFFDRRQLDSGQVVVGRSAKTCDLVLPDEEGFVSRAHCTLSTVGLELFVVDTSKNGVALNAPDMRIAPNLPVAVRPNDRLLIGNFVITIATEAMGAGIGLVPPPVVAVAPTSVAQNDPWFDKPAEPIWDQGPLGAEVHDFLQSSIHDFLAPPAGAGMLAAAPSDFGFGDPIGHAFSRPIMADPLPPPADFGIPEDWATGGAPAPAQASVAPAPRGPADPFPEPDDRGVSAAPSPALSSVDPFTPPLPTSADPFALPSLPASDPFDLGTPLPPSEPDWAMPSAPPAAPSPVAAPPVAAPAPGPAIDAAGWAAFFEGAGLAPGEVHLSPDAMHRLGVLYRQVVLGLWDIIQDRAAFKDEFRVERTQLSIGRNNPLKHLPPLDAAKLLLGDPLPGFMGAEDAVRTAFEDIKKHQLAMLAGVQQALSAVFDRLSPQEIDALAQKAAGQRKGLPFGRGISPWSVYLTVFEALKKDATSNANGVMSVAFREGYERFLKSAQ